MANFLGLGSLLGISRHDRAIDLLPVATEELETSTDKRLRKLRYCVRANHANYAVISSKTLPSGNLLGLVRCSNNWVALLIEQRMISCYFLGATPERLAAIYERHSANEEKWKDSPGEVTDDWRAFLGKPECVMSDYQCKSDRAGINGPLSTSSKTGLWALGTTGRPWPDTFFLRARGR